MLILFAAFLPFLVFGFILWYVVFRIGSAVADLFAPRGAESR